MSKLCKDIDDRVNAFLERPLVGDWPCLWLDATYLKQREGVGLTVAAAFDPGQSIRAGAAILVEAYQRCRRGGAVAEQPALRCAASIYNTGREQAGILNGYQAKVWRVAAQIVPAIQLAAGAETPPGIAPSDVVAPRPRAPLRLPAAVFEDALHPSPPAQDEEGVLSDALHLPEQKDAP